MRILLFLLAFLLFACGVQSTENTPLSKAIASSAEPTCTEKIYSIIRKEDEVRFGDNVADYVINWNYLADWKIVDTGKCRALTLRDSYLFFSDGSLYDSYNLSKPLQTSAKVKERLVKVYMCRFKALSEKPLVEPDCSNPD